MIVRIRVGVAVSVDFALYVIVFTVVLLTIGVTLSVGRDLDDFEAI